CTMETNRSRHRQRRNPYVQRSTRRLLRIPSSISHATLRSDWDRGFSLGRSVCPWRSHPTEYKRLRKHQPSYQDKYDLLAIEKGVFSEWMLFRGYDIGAHVRRKSDGKEFWLGLAELKAVAPKSPAAQMLHDF